MSNLDDIRLAKPRDVAQRLRDRAAIRGRIRPDSDPLLGVLRRAADILDCEHNSLEGTDDMFRITIPDGVLLAPVMACAECGREIISFIVGDDIRDVVVG